MPRFQCLYLMCVEGEGRSQTERGHNLLLYVFSYFTVFESRNRTGDGLIRHFGETEAGREKVVSRPWGKWTSELEHKLWCFYPPDAEEISSPILIRRSTACGISNMPVFYWRGVRFPPHFSKNSYLWHGPESSHISQKGVNRHDELCLSRSYQAGCHSKKRPAPKI